MIAPEVNVVSEDDGKHVNQCQRTDSHQSVVSVRCGLCGWTPDGVQHVHSRHDPSDDRFCGRDEGNSRISESVLFFPLSLCSDWQVPLPF